MRGLDAPSRIPSSQGAFHSFGVRQGTTTTRAAISKRRKRKSLRLRELAMTCEAVPQHVTQRANGLEPSTFSLEVEVAAAM